uniref:Retrotransposon gag domain-containing protein n=1 Tax=Aegilops tauschii subsp. strangulata TaxID=200361 RepID=A0A453L5W8_AEGTS
MRSVDQAERALHRQPTPTSCFLQQEFFGCHQDNSSVDDYCRRLKTLADELRDIGTKIDDDLLLSTLTAGLNEDFGNAAANLTLIPNPLRQVRCVPPLEGAENEVGEGVGHPHRPRCRHHPRRAPDASRCPGAPADAAPLGALSGPAAAVPGAPGAGAPPVAVRPARASR